MSIRSDVLVVTDAVCDDLQRLSCVLSMNFALKTELPCPNLVTDIEL